MLSVGIDIDRLGVMTVHNQPKSNTEYIQATSRVGRRNPGIVLAIYNNLRSRDKSYYEQFCYYHKSFYRYVEATSVTPFSVRTIEKALHCVFIALVKLTIPRMAANDSTHDWEYIAVENSNTLCYKSNCGQPSLLISAEVDSEMGLPKILNPLRNVDPSVNVYFRK